MSSDSVPEPALPPATRPDPVTLTEAFWYWLKLGFISFGGPTGQIALMHTDLVERKRWISEQRFLHALNYCMLLPGPEAMQLAVYIGWLMHRTAGGIIAGVLFVLPSLLILIALSWVYLAFGDLPVVAGVLYGIKPAIIAIVLAAAWRIGRRTLKNRWLVGIAALAFSGIALLHLPFPLIIGIAALAGLAGGRWLPEHFRPGGGHAASQVSYGAALIDDDTPPPDHARFGLSDFVDARDACPNDRDDRQYDHYIQHGRRTRSGLRHQGLAHILHVLEVRAFQFVLSLEPKAEMPGRESIEIVR